MLSWTESTYEYAIPLGDTEVDSYSSHKVKPD